MSFGASCTLNRQVAAHLAHKAHTTSSNGCHPPRQKKKPRLEPRGSQDGAVPFMARRLFYPGDRTAAPTAWLKQNTVTISVPNTR